MYLSAENVETGTAFYTQKVYKLMKSGIDGRRT